MLTKCAGALLYNGDVRTRQAGQIWRSRKATGPKKDGERGAAGASTLRYRMTYQSFSKALHDDDRQDLDRQLAIVDVED